MGQKILLIEDNEVFRRTVRALLEDSGYAVSEAGTGKAGLAEARKGCPDLVILDLVLPGMMGTEVCRELKRRPETAGVVVLILTGNDKDGQEIALLDLGADDYLTKPVKGERLLAHCRALLRRAEEGSAKPPVLELGGLRLDYPRKTVVWKGKEFSQLTPKEFGLLYELARKSPEPRDRAALYRKVWGIEPPSEGSLKTVDVHARRIRLKLGWAAGERLTYVNGRGYCLAKGR